MKDIDFEELDKAVNSLMSGGGISSQPKPKDEDRVLNIDAPKDKPVEDVPKPEPAVKPVFTEKLPSAPNPSEKKQPLAEQSKDLSPSTSSRADQVIAPKRAGRFMDMVHQSSDMRNTRTISPPSARASRYQGGVVQPTTAADADTQPVSFEPKMDASTVPDFDASPVEPTSMPDPIDFSQKLNDQQTPGAKEQQVGAEGGDGELGGYSPFVAGAKVDKRPLGSAPNAFAAPTTIEEAHIERDLDKAAENQLPISADEQMPAELQSDLVAIESEAAIIGDESPAESKSPVRGVEAVKQPEAPKVESPARPVIESIPNQYVADKKPSSDEVEGDIFNTDAFAQPLAHPVKRKSGWLTVLFIFLLIVLGVGIGAVLYLYVL